MITLRPFEFADLHTLPGLQPEGWDDIQLHYRFYLTAPFCFPLKACDQDQHIVGVGNAVHFQQSGWLSHIIVSDRMRNKGIGYTITKGLVDLLAKCQCNSIHLIATTLGQPVYEKLGFVKELNYCFFSREHRTPSDNAVVTLPFTEKYRSEILRLDNRISGEVREPLLSSHLEHAQLFLEHNLVKGCYFPSLGEGLIIADVDEIGLGLMELRHRETNKTSIPEANRSAIDLLKRTNFQEIRQGTRMRLGKPLSWNPSSIYGRIGGNLG